MPGAKRLIVGLGNPGSEYAHTRHNIGFWVVDAIAEQYRLTFRRESSGAQVAWGNTRGRPFGLVKPQLYMNRSGTVAQHLLRGLGLRTDEMLVVIDDINLEPGIVRLRARGSAGGHNGLQDIIDRLGTDEFPRLRVGIGSDFRRGRQVDYVLSPFAGEELPKIREAVIVARDAALTFVEEGIVHAMNRFNRK